MDVGVKFSAGVKKWEAGGGRWEKGGRFQKVSKTYRNLQKVSETFSADKTIQTIIQKIPENGSKKYPENSDKSVLNYRHLFLRGTPSQKVQNFGRWV